MEHNTFVLSGEKHDWYAILHGGLRPCALVVEYWVVCSTRSVRVGERVALMETKGEMSTRGEWDEPLAEGGEGTEIEECQERIERALHCYFNTSVPIVLKQVLFLLSISPTNRIELFGRGRFRRGRCLRASFGTVKVAFIVTTSGVSCTCPIIHLV